MRFPALSSTIPPMLPTLRIILPLLFIEPFSWSQQCNPDVIEGNRPAAVFIEAKHTVANTGKINSVRASGFIISNEGYVLTSSRRLFTSIEKIDEISFAGAHSSGVGQTSPMELIARIENLDIAVFRFRNTSEQWKSINLGNSFDARIGADICSMSFPLDIEYLLRPGIISSQSAPGGMWYSSIPYNEGEEGGPVFDAKSGTLLGMIKGPSLPVPGSPRAPTPNGQNIIIPIHRLNGVLSEYAGIIVQRRAGQVLAAALTSMGSAPKSAESEPIPLPPPIESRASNPKGTISIFNLLWRKPQIYVCWENPSSQFTTEMLTVKEEIQRSWQKESQLQFLGWQKCANESRGVRIKIEDSFTMVKKIGRDLDGTKDGVVLNFTFNQWNPECKSIRIECIRFLAKHEFGHVIGFAHSTARPDAPAECRSIEQGPEVKELLTPYDPESIMNFCNPTGWKSGGQLSKLDIQALRTLYGPPN